MYKKASLTNSDFYGATKEFIDQAQTKSLDTLVTPKILSDSFANLISFKLTTRASIYLILETLDTKLESIATAVATEVKSVVQSKKDATTPDDIKSAITNKINSIIDSAKAKTTIAEEELNKAKQSIKNALNISFTGISKSLLSAIGLPLLAGLNAAKEVGSELGDKLKGTVTDLVKRYGTQTKYKPNPDYSEEAPNPPITIWGVSNDYEPIKQLLTTWTNLVYLGVDPSDLNKAISFRNMINDIIKTTDSTGMNNLIQIPYQFKTKKEVVDYFIDDVAKISPVQPPKTKSSQRIHFFRRIIKSN